jgi:hypothetical protein
MPARDPLLPALRQLTNRDRRLLGLLYDHKVLTTEQIATALFPNLDTAQHRLVVLYRLGVVDRFRWLREGGGSYSWRYTIAYLGAAHIAAMRGDDPPRRDHILNRNRRLASSPTIDHTLGANGFFTALLGHARAHPSCALRRWWSPEQCRRPGAFGSPVVQLGGVHPDGHGIWTEGDRATMFFVEHDTGTEPLGRLVDKVERYAGTSWQPVPRLPVLFWLHSTVREHHFHRRLASTRPAATVATAARDHAATVGAAPADAIWTPHGEVRQRVSLADLGFDHEPTKLADFLNEPQGNSRDRTERSAPG